MRRMVIAIGLPPSESHYGFAPEQVTLGIRSLP